MKTLCFTAFVERRIFIAKKLCSWTECDSRGDPPFFGHFFPTEAHARNTPPQVLVAGGWWWVAGGWWLAGWALVAGGWWLEYRFRLQINSCRTAYFTRFSDNPLRYTIKNTVKNQVKACPGTVTAPRVPYFTRVSEHALTWNAKNIVKYQQTCDHASDSSQLAPYFTRFSGARMQFYDVFLMKTPCFTAFLARRIFTVKN